MIEMAYTISQADFAEATKIWSGREAKRLPGRYLVTGVGIVFGGCIGLSLHYLPVWLAVCLGASFLANMGAAQWRRQALRHLQYARRIGIAETCHVRIDETGYHDEKPELCRSSMDWRYFANWIETPRVFVMGRDLNYITIPKAVLTAEQQIELRSLLNEKLGPVRWG